MIIDPLKLESDLERKLVRNIDYDKGHINKQGKRLTSLKPSDIIDTLDHFIQSGLNDQCESFLERLFWIIAYQTHHVNIDEQSGISYSSIATMIKRGNPKLDSLADVLEALDAALALCSVEDSEKGIDREELSRACFVSENIQSGEKWPLQDAMQTLSLFKLQLRVFSVETVQRYNDLEFNSQLVLPDIESVNLRGMKKPFTNITSLLRLFNLEYETRFVIDLSISPRY
jgi:DNA-binding phage protein